MTTPEAKVKAKVRTLLKKYGAYFFTPVGTGFGSSGVPDIVACLNGRFVAIECKAGKGKLTELQAYNLAKISAVDGYTLVVNEEKLQELDGLLSLVSSLPKLRTLT